MNPKKDLLKFKRSFKTDAQDLIADDMEAFIGNYYLNHRPKKTIKYFEKLLTREINAFDPNTDYNQCSKIPVPTGIAEPALCNYRVGLEGSRRDRS